MKYVNDIRDLIGHTPLLKLNHITEENGVNLFAKLEYFNPGGSIKDRIGMQIIREAEEDGSLQPGAVIIEATAGNTGIGLALAAVGSGHPVKIVIPEKFSIEKQILMRALGAELIITPSEEGMEGAIARAKELLHQIPGSFMAKQFENPANIHAHLITGQEIYEDLDGNVDIVVAGAGSGGTITGIATYIKQKNPAVKIILADPYGSILGGGEPGTYQVEGIGNHFIPDVFDRALIDEVEKIPDEEALHYVQLLAKQEGVIGGSSSGEAVAAAIRQAKKAPKGTNIVILLPDRGDRYFSKNLYQINQATD